MRQRPRSSYPFLIWIVLIILSIIIFKNCSKQLFFSSIQSQILGRWQCINQDSRLLPQHRVTIWNFQPNGKLTLLNLSSPSEKSGQYFLRSENWLKIKWRNRDFSSYEISLRNNQLTLRKKNLYLICQKL
jgi:hypothetical protein